MKNPSPFRIYKIQCNKVFFFAKVETSVVTLPVKVDNLSNLSLKQISQSYLTIWLASSLIFPSVNFSCNSWIAFIRITWKLNQRYTVEDRDYCNVYALLNEKNIG